MGAPAKPEMLEALHLVATGMPAARAAAACGVSAARVAELVRKRGIARLYVGRPRGTFVPESRSARAVELVGLGQTIAAAAAAAGISTRSVQKALAARRRLIADDDTSQGAA